MDMMYISPRLQRQRTTSRNASTGHAHLMFDDMLEQDPIHSYPICHLHCLLRLLHIPLNQSRDCSFIVDHIVERVHVEHDK